MICRNKVFYSLNTDDIQRVAMDEIDRELTEIEINEIIGAIEDKLPWYEAISLSINENIK